MAIRKGMRYRLYPTPEQENFLRRVSRCVRLTYNLALEQRETFGRRGRSFRYEGQRAELAGLKACAEFLKEVPHYCLQEALVDLQGAFERFFKGISGYPTPRKRGVNDGFRFPDATQFRIEKAANQKFVMLHLPKMGKQKGDNGALKLRLHRPMEGVVKSATLNHEAGVWYASFQCEVDIAEPVRPTGEAVGVDRGIAVPIMVSNDTKPYVPLPTPRQRERERRLHKTIARRRMGSNNRRKAVRRLGRFKAKEARRRRDALHKATTTLAKNHGLVVIEDLRVSKMTRSASGTVDKPGTNVAQKSGLNRAILSVGWGMTATMLDYKSVWHGSEVRRVPAPFTSQRCSACGHVDTKSRVSQSRFVCTSCGHAENADLNASKNIRDIGLMMTDPEDTRSGSACGAFCAMHGNEAGYLGRETGSPAIHCRGVVTK